MADLSGSDLFTTFAPFDSKLYLLTRKVAPVQQSFYFVNDGFSADGRYLWFYCAFPPSGAASGGRTLGVADLATGQTRHFPETQFGCASPYVDPVSGDVYWQQGLTTWRRGPAADSKVEQINAIPDEFVGYRRVTNPATHLKPSADGRDFFIDLSLEIQFLFGSLPLDGGDFQLWRRFDRQHNHAQFSPTDSNLVLFAEEHHSDPITGLRIPIRNRLWLMRRGVEPWPIFKEPTRVTHEWWDGDGNHVWCVVSGSSGTEVWRVCIKNGDTEKIDLKRDCWHAHASLDGRLIVWDSHIGSSYRGCASRVHFLNRESGCSLTLAENPARHDYAGQNYHIDPHPRFCCGDRYVVFTTTVREEVDLAVAYTEDLVLLTS